MRKVPMVILERGLSNVGRRALAQLTSGVNFDQKMPPDVLLPLAARASNVLGKIIDKIGDDRPGFPAPIKWLTHFLRLFWGLVEVAIPRSYASIVFLHWLRLIYLFEILMIVGGTILTDEYIQRFGVAALVYTIAIHAAVLILKDVMLRRGVWITVIAAAAVLFFVIVAGFGIATVAALLGNDATRRFLTTTMGLRP